MKFFKFNLKFLTLLLLGTVLIQSCDKDEPADDTKNPISSFQFAISETNFLEVTFSNFSQDATSYAWNFGDTNTSTVESPTHTYATAGDYTVELTVTGADNKTATSSKAITITDPDSAAKLLTGETSKTWKLFREGTSIMLDPHWPGMSNNGARPCLYAQTFTYHADGKFVFDDMGMFWGEDSPWKGTTNHETCFEPTSENMINLDGTDVSAWGSGEHQFTYDPNVGSITLNGMGAWMGLVHVVGDDSYSNVPTLSRTFDAVITEEAGYDLLTITYDYGIAAGGVWTCVYASYSDASLEPAIETGGPPPPPPFGEDLDDISPTELFRGFSSADASDFILLDTIQSASTVDYGVDDPADASAAKVGQFNRTGAQYQELQFQTSPSKNDVNFENLSTVTIDVYFPSTNDYSGKLTQFVIVGLADVSNTKEWWTDQMEYHFDGNLLAQDEWHTLTVSLDAPSYVAKSETAEKPSGRNDYDMVYLQIGSGDHTEVGTFYVRNLRLN